MPTLVVTITVPTQDKPAVPLAQILRELVPVIETQAPPPASFTHYDRVLRTTRATWTYA